MQEFVNNAIVLTKEPYRDLDGRYRLFTEQFGHIAVKAKSSRKITSKLAPHLEPGNVVAARFIEKGGTQIVDALKIRKLPLSLSDLAFVAELLPENEPEPELWHLLADDAFAWRRVLAVLGWDPVHAVCAGCESEDVHRFYIGKQDFFCENCASKLRRDTIKL